MQDLKKIETKKKKNSKDLSSNSSLNGHKTKGIGQYIFLNRQSQGKSLTIHFLAEVGITDFLF